MSGGKPSGFRGSDDYVEKWRENIRREKMDWEVRVHI